MEGRIITEKIIEEFSAFLQSEEKVKILFINIFVMCGASPHMQTE